MKVTKEYNECSYESICQYFIDGRVCMYARSGYSAFGCITATCNECNGIINPPSLEKTRASNTGVTYYQYQPVCYLNKKGKSKKRTEREYRIRPPSVNAKICWLR